MKIHIDKKIFQLKYVFCIHFSYKENDNMKTSRLRLGD